MISNQVERDILIQAPVDVVWRVITEPQEISRWFTDTAELDLRPGGNGLFTWDARARSNPTAVSLQVEEVQQPHRFAFRWCHPEGTTADASNSTLVEFTLTPEGEDTRLRVVESGIAQTCWPEERKRKFSEEHSEGWRAHLEDLRLYASREVPLQAETSAPR